MKQTLAKALATALKAHNSGNLKQAEQIYRQILQADPTHVDALHLLGLVAHQIGRNDIAIEYMSQAVRRKPGFPEAHNNLGIALMQQGKLEEAVASYRQALRFKPDYPEAHNNLGSARSEQGKLEEAVASYRQALRLNPNYAEAHNNLGIIYLKQRKLDQAVTCYQKALRRKPDYPEAHNNLGNVYKEQGKMDEALACFREALRLKPDFPEAHSSLGNIYLEQGRLPEAEACYREALRLKPKFAEAYNNLGIALINQGKVTEAASSYQSALHYKPIYPEAHNNFGNALRDLNKPAEAEASYREALRLKPDYAEAHNNLGIALADLKKIPEALAEYQEALRLRAAYPEAYNNLANALKDQGKLEEAEVQYRQAIHLKPAYAEAHNNLGITLMDQGKLEEALVSYEEALRLKPDYPEAHKSRSFVTLLQGKYEEGWPDYEWRWKTKEFSMPAYQKPLWDGSPLEGRTIVLHTEQGLGDTLQFIRYAALVKQRGGRVIVRCQKPLKPILARTPGIDQLEVQDADLPAFDVHAPVMSLPYILKTTLATVPANVPYVLPDPALVEQWGRELKPIRTFKIGIVWQGNPGYKGDKARSIPLSYFTRLARVEGVQFFSLQKNFGIEQLPTVADRMAITDLGPRLDVTTGPFMDTAAVMTNLDLLITSDTAIPHLAGALGVPTWVVLPFLPDWRWLRNREDSPWYPSMRLFRQPERGNWADVFERIAVALQEKLTMTSTLTPRTASVAVDLSPGELIDKITILEIKDQRISDPAKLANVRVELAALLAIHEREVPPSERLTQLTAQLKAVNETLWDIEDHIRVCERDKDFGPRFIELARSVYHQNDRRAAFKRQINELLGSQFIEEKAYVSYA